MCTISISLSIRECLNNTQQVRIYIALAITTYRFVRGISWANIVLRAFYSYQFIKYFPFNDTANIVQSNINLCLLIQILCVQITMGPIVLKKFFFQNLNENNQRCVHEESILDIARASGGLSVVVKSTTNFVEIFLYDTNVPPFTERLHPKNIKTNQFRSIFKNPQITMIFNHLLKPEYFEPNRDPVLMLSRLCNQHASSKCVSVTIE